MNKYFLLAFLIGMILLNSCSEEFPDNPNGNSPPNTGVFLYPDSSVTQQPSRLTVRWWGDDPDGLISGFYFKWEGIDDNWSFTTKNDSTFSLPIGSSDTTYNFLVSAVDASGNGFYDSQLIQNGIDFGGEPYVDENNNGKYDNGEFFYDIGLIDPTPASTLFPIKNTSPEIDWNELSFLPDTSFPVVTIAWNAGDLDGDESITEIEVALNDTNNFVSLNGSVRLITLRGVNLNTNPEVEILINASSQNIHPEKLQGIILNGDNKIFIRAKDLSGASSEIIQLPDTNSTWFVKKPKGEVLIFDDYSVSTNNNQNTQFYNQIFSTMNGGVLTNKYDVFDLANNSLAFESVTILETLKLFKFIFWYSASNPRLDLLNIVTEKFNQSGGKIAFSMIFQDSSSSYPMDLSSLQGFLPIDGISDILGTNGYVLAGADILPVSQNNFPILETSSTISFSRSLVPNSLVAEPLYDFYDKTGLNYGNIAFRTTSKNLFFIGLPLYYCNGGSANVPALLEKIFFEDFGVAP